MHSLCFSEGIVSNLITEMAQCRKMGRDSTLQKSPTYSTTGSTRDSRSKRIVMPVLRTGFPLRSDDCYLLAAFVA
jgi:hypothetical protein